MKKIMATVITVAALLLVLVGNACGGEEGAIKADSDMQKAMKMVPSEWNMFYYLDAKKMRADTEVPKGLNALWDVADGYLDEFIDAMELDSANWPLPIDEIDYLGIASGGGSSGPQTWEPPSMVFIVNGSFSLSAVSNYLRDFEDNYPNAGVSFTKSNYKEVETWAPDTEQHFEWQEDPDILIALTSGSSIALVGDAEGVRDCIDTIKGTGDGDSILGNEGVKELSANFGDAAFAMIIDGEEEMPDYGYEGAPNYPDSFDGTFGMGLSRVGDKIRMECVGEMSDWSEWQEFIVNEMPEEGYLPYPFGISPYYSSGRSMDEARRTERANVATAVTAMMADNGLYPIPNPVTSPTNDMSKFPDILSDDDDGDKATDPDGDAYTYPGDKKGYILWDHDKTAEGDQTNLERYTNIRTTTYYYTVEADGTVHQWSGSSGTEYID